MSIGTNQIGDVIKVETTYKETIIGEIYCIDKNAGILVLHILFCIAVHFGLILNIYERRLKILLTMTLLC